MGKTDRPEKSSSDKVRKSNDKESSKVKSSKPEAKSAKKSSSTKEAASKLPKKDTSHKGSARRDGKESKAKVSSKAARPSDELAELEAEEAAALKKAEEVKMLKESTAKKEASRASAASSKYLPEPQLILRSRSRSRKKGGAAAVAQPAVLLDERSCSARSSSGSADGSEARRRVLQKRDEAGLRPASGFSMSGDASLGALAPLPEKIRGLLNNTDVLSQDVAILKQAVEHNRGGGVKEETEEDKQTMIKMQQRLHESLLHPENLPRLLAVTGLESVRLNSDGLVVLKAPSKKALTKALGQLRRLAYHCQWGCNHAKVSGLLAAKPVKPIHTMVIRLAATSSKLASHEARLTSKVRKLRIGAQAGIGQFVIEGVPGMSRRHCTVTFEPDKGAVYVQDLSTNGTYLNSKRLPRPPYKNPTDARVRVFHGDELFFRLRTEDSEELGFIVNLYSLS